MKKTFSHHYLLLSSIQHHQVCLRILSIFRREIEITSAFTDRSAQPSVANDHDEFFFCFFSLTSQMWRGTSTTRPSQSPKDFIDCVTIRYNAILVFGSKILICQPPFWKLIVLFITILFCLKTVQNNFS